MARHVVRIVITEEGPEVTGGCLEVMMDLPVPVWSLLSRASPLSRRPGLASTLKMTFMLCEEQ